MSGADHKQYLKISAALKNGDFAAVETLVKEDDELTAFGHCLTDLLWQDRLSTLQTCLTLPSLDRDSLYYKGMLLNLSLLAIRDHKTQMIDMLLSLSEDAAGTATLGLSRIFNAKSGDSAVSLNTATGKLLIEKGADVEKAASQAEDRLIAEIKQKGQILKEIRRYKADITDGKPAAKKCASCSCSRQGPGPCKK